MDQWLDRMWLELHQDVQGYYETDKVLGWLQVVFEDTFDAKEKQRIADFFYGSLSDDGGYCTREDLR